MCSIYCLIRHSILVNFKATPNPLLKRAAVHRCRSTTDYRCSLIRSRASRDRVLARAYRCSPQRLATLDAGIRRPQIWGLFDTGQYMSGLESESMAEKRTPGYISTEPGVLSVSCGVIRNNRKTLTRTNQYGPVNKLTIFI